MSNNFYGSICLSDIPKELIKRVKCKDGVERAYLNISVGQRKQPSQLGGRTITHYISCAPKKEERKEGVNYFIGDLSPSDNTPQQAASPQAAPQQPEPRQAAPKWTPPQEDDLPF